MTCLHMAAMDGGSEIVEVLLEGGADPNAKTSVRMTRSSDDTSRYTGLKRHSFRYLCTGWCYSASLRNSVRLVFNIEAAARGRCGSLGSDG
jgi:ankyrin repeat protein